MILADLLRGKPIRLVSVSEDAHFGFIYDVMKSNKVQHVAVLREQSFLGLVHQESLLDAIMVSPHGFERIKAKDIMICNLPQVGPETLVEDIVHMMRDNQQTALPYIENSECKTLITRTDLLKLTSDRLTEEDPNIIEQAIIKGEVAMVNPLLQKIMNLLSDIGI